MEPERGRAGRAAAEGVIATAASTPQEALTAADLVVLAGPATACIDLVRLLRPRGSLTAAPDATITDVASTKGRILAAADDSELHVVGGHPMAGREIAGYGAADAELFVGRPWVIVPGSRARPEDVGARRVARPGDGRPAGADGRGGHTTTPSRRSATCRSCSSAALVEP